MNPTLKMWMRRFNSIISVTKSTKLPRIHIESDLMCVILYIVTWPILAPIHVFRTIYNSDSVIPALVFSALTVASQFVGVCILMVIWHSSIVVSDEELSTALQNSCYRDGIAEVLKSSTWVSEMDLISVEVECHENKTYDNSRHRQMLNNSN